MKIQRNQTKSHAEIVTEYQRHGGRLIIKPDQFIDDGQFHPVRFDGDKKDSGSYIVHLDNPANTLIIDHKTGFECVIFHQNRESLTPGERREWRARQEQIRQERAAAESERHVKAVVKARGLWQCARPATADHPYLQSKGVLPFGVRVARAWRKPFKADSGEWETLTIANVLLIPMRDEHGLLWNLQAIFPEPHPTLGRNKDILTGGRKTGLFHAIGKKPQSDSETICIVEGYATAATVHHATGYRTFTAFDAGNLPAVAEIVRRHYPNNPIVICADNDPPNERGICIGQDKANAAAALIDGLLAIPPITGFDFNDLANQKGACHV